MSRAIRFVMVTFQKLAASSLAAIRKTLRTRSARRLEKKVAPSPGPANAAEQDDRFLGEQEEGDPTLVKAPSFFADEVTMLAGLLHELARQPRDSKVDHLVGEIRRLDRLASERGREPEHILIFAEYRASQDLLVSALEGE